MADLNDEFWQKARQDADERRRTDFGDLQNELKGLETGRMERFLSADARDDRDPRKREQADGERLSRLQRLLMSDPAYAALYNDTFNKLREAEQAAEQALQALIDAREKVGAALEQTLESAARLPDGTRVFRDANGIIWSEHGEQVDSEIAQSIHWRRDEPAYETFTVQGETLEKIDKGIDEIRTGQVNILGKFREELEDEEDPVNGDRLNEIGMGAQNFQREIDNQLSNLVPTANLQTEVSVSPMSTVPLPPS